MKKTISCLLVCVSLISLTSCNHTEGIINKTDSKPSVTNETKPASTQSILTTEDGTPISPRMTPKETDEGYIYDELTKRGEIYFYVGKEHPDKVLPDESLKDILKESDGINLIETDDAQNGNSIILEFVEVNWNFGPRFKIYENDVVEFVFPKIKGKYKFDNPKLSYRSLTEYLKIKK